MSTTTYLITGASRGLGLETARQLLVASPQNRIIAAARDPASAKELQDLIRAHPGRISAATIDVASSESIKVSLCSFRSQHRHSFECQTGVAEVSELELAKDGIDVLATPIPKNAGSGSHCIAAF